MSSAIRHNDVAERLGILAQTTFKPGDIQETDLGAEPFDFVFLGQITYSLTLTENLDLFSRVFGALAPGGILVIDAIMRTEYPFVEVPSLRIGARLMIARCYPSGKELLALPREELEKLYPSVRWPSKSTPKDAIGGGLPDAIRVDRADFGRIRVDLRK